MGVLAAAGAGVAAVAGGKGSSTPDIQTLKVPTDAVFTISDLSQVENVDDCAERQGSYDLPFGSLVWCNDSKFACCLIPTEEAKPLAQVATLALSSGTSAVVLDKARGQDDGFEIYDARCTSQGVVWTEANIMDGTWRIFAGKLNSNGDALSTSSSSTRAPPIGSRPPPSPPWAGTRSGRSCRKADSTVVAASLIAQLKSASMGSSDANVVYESAGRMATAPYAAGDGVVITPRVTGASSYYQLTRVSENGDVTDTLTLPASMKPLEAGYGKTGFTFAFDATYSYGDGIANLGTYAPPSRRAAAATARRSGCASTARPPLRRHGAATG